MNDGSEHKQFIRPRKGRMVAGVCAGVGSYTGIDPNIIRVIFAAVTIFSVGAGALVYVVAWAVVPEEGESESIAESYINRKRR